MRSVDNNNNNKNPADNVILPLQNGLLEIMSHKW